ncbi:MAG: hypothetical protein ACJA1H_001463 [Glaciecola sp.]|jgi:hypothetical protein
MDINNFNIKLECKLQKHITFVYTIIVWKIVK